MIEYNTFHRVSDFWRLSKLEQLECLRSEDTRAASWLPTLLSHIRFQVKMKAEKLQKIAKNLNVKILL